MDRSELKGKVQTVTGLLQPDDLGFTAPHEHLLIDCSCYFVEPEDPKERELAHQPITLENLYYHLYHRGSLASIVLNSEETAIREVMRFKEAGGKTLVEQTPINVSRNPTGLVRVAQATGVNIIMGTAYYIDQSYTPEMRLKSEEDITDEFVKDITRGVDGTDIRAGIIGEMGCSWPLTKDERKALCAAAVAQRRTGAAISIHPGPNENAPLEIINILTEGGADPKRIVIGHMERTFRVTPRTARHKLAETGCYLEFDTFGADGFYPLMSSPYDLVPNDQLRIKIIKELIAAGHLEQLLISTDVCGKVAQSSYGGVGFIFIPNIILPLMRKMGVTEEQIHAITVKNPKRLLTFS